jgi:double zinc ribbon protein
MARTRFHRLIPARSAAILPCGPMQDCRQGLSMECPDCRHLNRESARFCGACGAPLPVRCPQCGVANPSTAKFCDACGARLASPAVPTAKPPLPPIRPTAAERRQLTVMFCDLVGSTGLSAQLHPEEMRELIALYRKCVSDAVARFEGFVAQHLGDGVLTARKKITDGEEGEGSHSRPERVEEGLWIPGRFSALARLTTTAATLRAFGCHDQ